MARTAPPPASRPDAFGLRDFLRVLDERRALIRSVALAVVTLTVAVLLVLPTLYSTSSVVMLDQRKNNLADISSVLSALPTDQSSVQNQIQMLTSRDLALKVIAKLRLYDDPEFNPALGAGGLSDVLGAIDPRRWGRAPPSAEFERDAVVDAFLGRLDAAAVGLSTTIDVTFTARDPAKAALIANTLADIYTEDQVATRIDAARRATQWLTDRMHQLSQQLQAQEAAVEQYKADHDLIESADGKSLLDEQLMAINTQLIQARSDLAQKKATYDRVQAVVKSGNAADVSQIVASPLITQLRTQEADLVRQEADLLSRYGPNHPKMQAIRAQKRDLEAKVAEEVGRISGSIANDVAVVRAQVASIAASLAQTEKQARGDNVARIKLNALEANLASTRTMYESFVSRLRAVQDQDDIQIPETRVISRAPIPSSPSSPHRTLFFLASIPAGLMLGVLLALLADRFEVPVGGAPVAPAFAPPRVALPPVLAELPATQDMRAADWAVQAPETSYGRALSALVDRIAAGGRVVALVSPYEDAGRPVIALALARLAARRGLRTILVDGDFRRPVIATALGYRMVPAGVGELLSGAAPLSRTLLKDPKSGAFVLTSAPGSAALWSSPKMTRLLDYFRRHCDLTIVDCGPAGAVLAARLADRVVVAVRSDAPKAGLDGALHALKGAGARTMGLIVTR
jgi:polysaccharide biosynthesis transport protein